MQYQVFVQHPADQRYVASIVGMPIVTVEGATEVEAIDKAKAALESILAAGKIVTIEVNPAEQPRESSHVMKYAGIFADDPTFEDWMEKLAMIRREANVIEAE